ncbi:hypothetical protein VaNZ11_017030 [Volvox africanus]|uniref:Uncharacterized protein n=1 Tax=Volvox africanus TaxID=51714 RepID=A0ABQ5SPY7_9CHLO|nr:hypothetical protein VaNZ11_017030 [Volvox africanus]
MSHTSKIWDWLGLAEAADALHVTPTSSGDSSNRSSQDSSSCNEGGIRLSRPFPKDPSLRPQSRQFESGSGQNGEGGMQLGLPDSTKLGPSPPPAVERVKCIAREVRI